MIGEGEHKCYTVLITHSIAAVCDMHTPGDGCEDSACHSVLPLTNGLAWVARVTSLLSLYACRGCWRS